MSDKEQIPSTDEPSPEKEEEGLKIPQAIVGSVVIVGIAAGVAAGLGTWIEALIAFGIQWLVLACQAYPFQSEKYYDFTGMITFLSVAIYSFFGNQNQFTSKYIRNIIMTLMVIIWTLRLGSFLFARIRRAGEDTRFAALKVSFIKFLFAWNLQGLWTFLISLPIIFVNSTSSAGNYPGLGVLDYIGWTVWVLGLTFEAVADHQKSVWREDPSNKGKWIDVGLWSISRHPNYFGEITIWWGQFIAAAAVFGVRPVGALSVLSPLYTMLLLIFVSGIPLLESRSDEKWGGQSEYEEYKKRTPVLVPFCYCWV